MTRWQMYKFGQQGQCLLEAITLKSEQWGKDRDWNVPSLQMDSWSIIGKFSTWEGRDGYIISFSSSKIEIFTEIMSMMSMKICWDDFASWSIVGVLWEAAAAELPSKVRLGGLKEKHCHHRRHCHHCHQNCHQNCHYCNFHPFW